MVILKYVHYGVRRTLCRLQYQFKQYILNYIVHTTLCTICDDNVCICDDNVCICDDNVCICDDNVCICDDNVKLL